MVSGNFSYYGDGIHVGNPMPETHFGTLGMVYGIGFYHINWGCLKCLPPICGNIEDYSLFNTNIRDVKNVAMAAMSHPFIDCL